MLGCIVWPCTQSIEVWRGLFIIMIKYVQFNGWAIEWLSILIMIEFIVMEETRERNTYVHIWKIWWKYYRMVSVSREKSWSFYIVGWGVSHGRWGTIKSKCKTTSLLGLHYCLRKIGNYFSSYSSPCELVTSLIYFWSNIPFKPSLLSFCFFFCVHGPLDGIPMLLEGVFQYVPM